MVRRVVITATIAGDEIDPIEKITFTDTEISIDNGYNVYYFPITQVADLKLAFVVCDMPEDQSDDAIYEVIP